MTLLIEQNQEAIFDLCRKYGVARLEVFGSAAGDTFDLEWSDVDFLVDFTPGDMAECFLFLRSQLLSGRWDTCSTMWPA